MGKTFSSLFNAVSRPVKNFNVENRAQSVISKNKAAAAPKHPSTLKYMEEAAKDDKFMQEQQNKPEELLNRLKIVKVADKTAIPSESETQSKSSKTLPQITKPVVLPAMGFVEPEMANKGKITLSDTLKALMNHQRDPNEWNASKISTDYKIDLKTTQDILAHYRLLTMEDLSKNSKPNQKYKLLNVNESDVKKLSS